MHRLCEWLCRGWRTLKRWYRILLPLRFSVIVVALVAWAFNGTAQGQDTIRYLAAIGGS